MLQCSINKHLHKTQYNDPQHLILYRSVKKSNLKWEIGTWERTTLMRVSLISNIEIENVNQ